MVVFLAAILVGLVVLAIAVLLVVREARRLTAAPPPLVFNLDEAYEWVVEHVPDLVAATLTPDDVRRILALQTEYLQRKGAATDGSANAPVGSVVIGDAEVVEYVLARAEETGEPYLPEQVHAVIETQLAYLRAIGAVGPQADQEER